MRASATQERIGGRAQFVDDMTVPGMLHGRLVRLEVARARILGIETAAAAGMPGVVRVFTAVDLRLHGSTPRFGPLVMDQPVLAADVTRYQGEPVALVVADTESAAVNAAQQVDVRYESLPPILTVDAALSADLLHAPTERPAEQARWKESNVMGEWTFAWGDVEAAEADAATVVEGTYSAPFVHHFAIETHAAIAIPEPDGVAIISSAQHPFITRRVLAEMLHLPLERVTLRSPGMGGSFGSKGYPKVEPAVALAALVLQRPVKIALSAEEAFATAQREASVIRARTGFDALGRIAFMEMEVDFLVGAYADISPRVVAKSGLHALAPYHAPHARVRARGLFSSSPPTTAFRGFGAPHTIFALESQMDCAAQSIGMDSLELRLANLRVKGAPSAYGETPVDGEWSDLLRKVAAGIGWGTERRAGVGRGLAIGIKTCIPATTSNAEVRLNRDGSALVVVGTTEMGQGTPALMADLAARELGIAPDAVSVSAGDTGEAPFDALTASSRSVVHMGNAVLAACADLKRQLAAGARPPDGMLIGEGSFSASADDSHPLGGPTPFYEAVATAVEIQIDPGTGLLGIDRIVHATDAGTVLDRQRATGLDEGGLMMGIGLAMSEQLVHAGDGRLLNGSSLDYRIPTIGDRPGEVVSLFQENGDGPGPYGAKGLAEGGILAVAPAIRAAIHDATGVFVDDLPFTPEMLWRALNR